MKNTLMFEVSNDEDTPADWTAGYTSVHICQNVQAGKSECKFTAITLSPHKINHNPTISYPPKQISLKTSQKPYSKYTCKIKIGSSVF